MGDKSNLKPKPFSKDNQPANRRSRKGVPNRSTVFKKLLETEIDFTNPVTQEALKLTMYEAAALGQIKAAIDGNPTAWKEIQDTLHGKIPDKLETKGENKVIFVWGDDDDK